MSEQESSSQSVSIPAAIPRHVVVRMAAIGEGILIVLSLVWLYLRELPVRWELSAETVGVAVVLTAPLIAVNGFLFLGPSGPRLQHPAWRIFSTRYIRPLCAELTPLPALVVAVLAGLGEELAFRGVLLTELRPLLGDWGAVVASGITFGWIHFLGLWREFLPVVVLYCLFGIVLGAIYLVTTDVALMVLIHALYDFLVICVVHRSVRRDGCRGERDEVAKLSN